MDGYEHIPDPGDAWVPSPKQVRQQRDREDMRKHAASLAREAPPLSTATAQRLATLLSQRPLPRELVEWRLRLFCGHVIARTAHHTHTSVHSAFIGGIACPDCGLDPATIIAAEALHRLEPDPAAPAASPDRDADLRKSIARHERAIERLRGQLHDRSGER